MTSRRTFQRRLQMSRPVTVAAQRRPGPQPVQGPARWMAGGMPAEKSLDFKNILSPAAEPDAAGAVRHRARC